MRYRELEKILIQDGWYDVGKKGSHHQFKHPAKPGKITVPEHAGRDIHPSLAKAILKEAGL